MENKPINNGGPAFPAMKPAYQMHDGMSIRDYFAGQALAGIVSNAAYLQAIAVTAQRRGLDDAKAIAMAVYELADAMLAARNA